jgi:hypothetical protein
LGESGGLDLAGELGVAQQGMESPLAPR